MKVVFDKNFTIRYLYGLPDRLEAVLDSPPMCMTEAVDVSSLSFVGL